MGGVYCEWYLFPVPISGEWGVGIKIGTGGYADGGSLERIDPKLAALETITTDVLDLGSCISERSRETGIVQRNERCKPRGGCAEVSQRFKTYLMLRKGEEEQQGIRRRGQREEKSKMPGC